MKVKEKVIKREIKKRVGLKDAVAIANRFILNNLPDRFSAGVPKRSIFFSKVIWIVPVIVSYPNIGRVGDVGIVGIDSEVGEVIGWTPFDEMKLIANKIYEEKKSEIEIAFS